MSNASTDHPSAHDVSTSVTARADDELCWLSIDELRSAYRQGDTSPVEVAEAHLTRIEALDAQVNAFVTVTADRAREDARAAQEHWRTNPHSAPPLLGVPIALKDLVPTAGIRTAKGSLRTADWVPQQDSPLAARLLGAGGLMMGKTTTSEAGWKADAGNRVNGPARNPHDVRRAAGGSSGGAAAAVAAGFVPVAQGGDGAGSVRIPASFCGTVGIKPGPGVVPYYPPSPLGSLVANGSFGRSVRDAATLLDVMSGPDPRDSASMVRPAGGYRAACDRPLRRLRIAYVPHWGGRAAEPETLSALDAVAQGMRSEGHHVDVRDDSPTDRFDLLDIIWTTGFASLFPDAGDDLDPGLRVVIEAAKGRSGADLAAAHQQRQVFKADVASYLQPYDVVLTPTCAVTAFPVGQDGPTHVNGERAKYLDWAWYTYAFNLSEHPAVSLPCGTDREGLPIGAQLVAPHGAERSLLSTACSIEAVIKA